MAMSGIKMADDCKTIYEAMKMNTKENCNRKTRLFSVNDKKTEIVHIEIPEDCPSNSFEEMKAMIKDHYSTKPLYILHDLKYISDDKRPQNKLIIINWCDDDTVAMRSRMVHAASFDAVKAAFTSAKPWPVHSFGDFLFEEAVDKAKK